MDDYKVRDGIWDEVTKIGTIGRKRHTVIFPDRDGEETTLTMCNECGSPFTINGKLCSGCGELVE